MREEVQAAALADLVTVMDRLRSPDGCPWDAEQTHASLVPFVIEEAFEVVESIETDDRDGLREELGDLLLQVVFHARIAQEHRTAPFDLGDVAAGIAAKLRRRHPHVFGGTTVSGAADVSARWDEIKRAEKGRTSALDGIPIGLPALARAQAVLRRARGSGAAPEAEVGPRGSTGTLALPAPVSESALGDGLLALVAAGQAAGWDAERALRSAVRRLEQDLRSTEPARDGEPPVRQ